MQRHLISPCNYQTSMIRKQAGTSNLGKLAWLESPSWEPDRAPGGALASSPGQPARCLGRLLWPSQVRGPELWGGCLPHSIKRRSDAGLLCPVRGRPRSTSPYEPKTYSIAWSLEVLLPARVSRGMKTVVVAGMLSNLLRLSHEEVGRYLANDAGSWLGLPALQTASCVAVYLEMLLGPTLFQRQMGEGARMCPRSCPLAASHGNLVADPPPCWSCKCAHVCLAGRRQLMNMPCPALQVPT